MFSYERGTPAGFRERTRKPGSGRRQRGTPGLTRSRRHQGPLLTGSCPRPVLWKHTRSAISQQSVSNRSAIGQHSVSMVHNCDRVQQLKRSRCHQGPLLTGPFPRPLLWRKTRSAIGQRSVSMVHNSDRVQQLERSCRRQGPLLTGSCPRPVLRTHARSAIGQQSASTRSALGQHCTI